MSSALSTRLEAAPSGSRALSDEVLRLLGWELLDGPSKGDPRVWKSPRWACYLEGQQPSPTESVDDAIGLWHGEGELRLHVWIDPERGLRAWAGTPADDLPSAPPVRSCATPALAICAALVRARELI